MTSFLNDINGRYAAEKRTILNLCIKGSGFSLADLAKELDTSIPKISRIVTELLDMGYLADLGKQESASGRRPSIYGLNPGAGYFVGVDVGQDSLTIAVTDFPGRVVHFEHDVPYRLQNTEESVLGLCSKVIEIISKARIDRTRVRSYGVNLTGRVNHETGYSYTYFISEEKPIRSILEQGFGKTVSVENDSHGMAYGEYMSGIAGDAGNILFLNVGWGLGMGMVLDGKLFYGKSGFSGEVGHFPMLDNNQICRCGKIGCLETGASGLALHRLVKERIKEGQPSLLTEKMDNDGELTLNDILDAVQKEDVTAIECVEEIGATLGRAVAGLINIFNPDIVIIGGRLSAAERYLMPPLKIAVNKLSLNLVNNDTVIKVSRLGLRAGAIGASLLAKSRMLNN
ncbi:MAG: ROK family protein [Bacteroidales bacterium]|nr:ROK family protein [Bacteroidales bacterium]